ncbi:probable LRR receptor-like serine/threonine-protein kinase At2g16250 [Nicotiana sylvestris]|uniref:Probable LRR receptor-like serine/threonine-protein kinase At2g16250 n=2 Tax=Nicotiana TaxID=4085 RepID=A0A1S4AB07_TOBAC|nr:PREDICTED: probable LRR receptor-like serine/threonine-protein kinase At2g16250 isoform X1 [Nicotiana sylvestris]XP_016473733.1 PREDICTED: probable LRR receptor-like serine/threonine-protein kinase At2g16250 [Nicotiana tabacum]
MLQDFMGTQFKAILFLLFFYSVLAKQNQLSSNLEYQDLLNLRSSLGIRARDWPRKSDPCSNWTGIVCNNGKVTSIKLTGVRRSHKGSLFPQFAVDSLANFTQLTSFNSSGFILLGPIPDWFGQRLSQLKELDLSSSSILGSLPPSLGSMIKLTSLSLSSNSITGTIPTEFGKLSSLKVLNLSGNSLTGSIPSSYSDIGNLTVLDLSSNLLSGPIPIEFGSFHDLKFLNLSNNSLSSYIPAQLANLSQLVELDLGYNYLSGSLPEDFSRLRNLRKLLIENNELEGELPSTLFSNLSLMEYIVLSWNRFEGEIPDVLWSLSHLRILDISGNNFTGVVSNFTNFSVSSASYNLSNNLFFGNEAFDIRNFQSIDLSNNYFQGLAPNNSGIQVMSNCFTGSLNQRSSEDCRKFYADRGLVFVNGSTNGTSQTPAQRSSKSGHTRLLIMVGVFGGLGVLMLLALAILLFLKICYTGNSNERGTSNVSPVVEGDNHAPVKFSSDISGSVESFTYEQILQATSNLNETNLIKHGHTGDIFRGILEGGVPIVIKKVSLLQSEKESYKLELDLLNWITHHRFVPLLGHCLEHESEKFLVYKYMRNGDLFSLLSRDTDLGDENRQSLDWITRLKIAIGTAEGLAYLHHECNPPLVHRDVQASSILLDDKFEVRLGSLSEVCTQEGDNHNLITKFFHMPKNAEGDPTGSSFTSCTYDVYCFGKVLLELVTGKVGISQSDDASTKEWLNKFLPFITIREKELVANIVDPSLILDEDLLEEMWAVAIVAKACLHPRPSKRPEMRRVLKALENPFKVVREGSFNSTRLRTTSLRRSWSVAFLGNWHHSSQDSINASGQTSKEGINLRQSGRVGSHSHSSGNERSSSCKRSSSEIFPEPQETLDIERQDMN